MAAAEVCSSWESHCSPDSCSSAVAPRSTCPRLRSRPTRSRDLVASESPGLSLPIFVQETPTAEATPVPSPTAILFSFASDSPSPSGLFTPTPSFDAPTPTPTQQTGPTPTPTQRHPRPTPTTQPHADSHARRPQRHGTSRFAGDSNKSRGSTFMSANESSGDGLTSTCGNFGDQARARSQTKPTSSTPTQSPTANYTGHARRVIGRRLADRYTRKGQDRSQRRRRRRLHRRQRRRRRATDRYVQAYRLRVIARACAGAPKRGGRKPILDSLKAAQRGSGQ